ncbi:MAG: hypothetical protein JWN80_2694 [Microbacteriaceae bacterium]|jgi:ribose transport system substrate-binding protein|nr:hypothetical protein [Microbacteriaceae bacterium]
MKVYRKSSRRMAASIIGLAVAGLVLAGCSTVGGSSSSSHGKVSVGQTGTSDQVLSDPSTVCGKKKMVIGIADGLGQNSWSAVSYAVVENEAKKCSNTVKVIRTAANGNPSKAISDINSLVAQGANVITVIPDAGPVGPVMGKAMKAGVAMITWGAPATGAKTGTDQIDNIQIDRVNDGVLFGKWLTSTLHGQGNILLIGGPAGNSLTPLTEQGVKEAFKSAPGMKILNDSPAVTNWDAASTTQAVATLLSQYPKIDGIVTESVQNLPGIIEAFHNAGRPLVPVTMEDGQATPDSSKFAGACLYVQNKAANPNFQIAATSSGNDIGALALRKAIAYYQGTTDNEPSILKAALIEDSVAGGALEPKC